MFNKYIDILSDCSKNILKQNGLDAIVEIQSSNPEAKFIIVTSTSRREEIVTAKSLNVLSYLVKPLKMEDLLVKVKKSFKKIREN